MSGLLTGKANVGRWFPSEPAFACSHARRDFARSRKFRNVAAEPKVCFLVDDVLPPWQPRAVQVRGHGVTLDAATWPDGTPREAIIRITPALPIT